MENHPYRSTLEKWLKERKLPGNVNDFSGGHRVVLGKPEDVDDGSLEEFLKANSGQSSENGLEIEAPEELDLERYLWIDFQRSEPMNDILVLGIAPNGLISAFDVSDKSDPDPLCFSFNRVLTKISDEAGLIAFLDKALATEGEIPGDLEQ